MTVKLTPAVLARAYSLLSETPPFARWKLPPAESVKFRVTRAKGLAGYYDFIGGQHIIGVSSRSVGYLPALLATVAHEMVHLHLRLAGRGNVQHGPAFQRLAKSVCKRHGFDPKEFG